MQTPISQHNQKPKPVTHPDFHIPVLVNRARVIATTTCLASDIFYLTKGLDNGRILPILEEAGYANFDITGHESSLLVPRVGVAPHNAKIPVVEVLRGFASKSPLHQDSQVFLHHRKQGAHLPRFVSSIEK